MKTSYKLLTVLAGLVTMVIIIGLASVRDDLQSLLDSKEAGISYSLVSVADFDKLDVSGKWKVKLRQGDVQKVELAAETPAEIRRSIEASGGTLHFRLDSATELDTIYVKITTPRLVEIRAANGAEVGMWNFKADSLSFMLESNAVLIGDNNRIEFATYKVKGDAELRLIDFPDI